MLTDESITLRRSVEDLGFFLAFLKLLAATGGVASMRTRSLSSPTSSDNRDTSLSFFLEEVIYKQKKQHEGYIITILLIACSLGFQDVMLVMIIHL